MRVLVIGASGAIGVPLVQQLVAADHEVLGTHHRPETAERLRRLGAQPVQLDLLDSVRARRVVLEARPDAIIHEATALGSAQDLRRKSVKATVAKTTQLRTKGTDTLLEAGSQAGVKRFVAQSFGNFRHARNGGQPKTEMDPDHPSPPKDFREPWNGLRHLEQAVTRAGGVGLRYGAFYGAPDDGFVKMVTKRRFPVIGDGTSVWSLIHVEDAAAATVLALERGKAGVYNIVDDDPARMIDWLPGMAEALGAKPPRRVPLWLARLFGGGLVTMMSESTGLSNAKAKQELGWRLQYPSWREGFPAAYAGRRRQP